MPLLSLEICPSDRITGSLPPWLKKPSSAFVDQKGRNGSPDRKNQSKNPCSSAGGSLLLSITKKNGQSSGSCLYGVLRPARGWEGSRKTPVGKDNTSGQTCEQVRPETHQNLIHPDKDRRLDLRHQRHRNSILRILRSRTVQCQSFSLLRDTLSPFRRPSRHHNPRSRTGGGGDRTRTDDPLLAKQVLSQLSYTPQSRIWQIQSLANEEHWWAREDLNLRPHAYQACALTS